VDVTEEASVSAALEQAAEAMGGLTCAISCAGIATAERTLGRKGPHKLESFRRTIDINLTGSFNVARLSAEIMAGNPDGEETGVIINTASVAAFDGQKGQTAYAASKGGVAALSLPLARDLASLKIRAMTIAPGIFRTPMLEGLGQDVMDGLAADVVHPARLGLPQEFARLATFIYECPYLNGTTIRLDGALRLP
ncbi:MAG: SDR family NAD(P)-dependent oxidoreductase, partial [Pseudomonadota bacterium]